jgi:hypothetical protein
MLSLETKEVVARINQTNTIILQIGCIPNMSPLPMAYVSDGVTTVIIYVMQGLHYSTLQCLTTLRTWHPIDVAY